MIANATLEKKFDVAVQPAWARRFGFPSTKRRPSLSSDHMLGLRPSLADLGPRLRLADSEQERPEATKLIASRRTAYGAVKISTSMPPRPGPEICAADRLISNFELPSMIWSRSTSDGRYDWYATSKKTWKTPTRKPTT